MSETLPWPVQGVAGWMPLWQAAGFFLATFVLEDAAVVGAGLLWSSGAISWPVAFASCFLGIWMGDAGLYTLARYGGRAWFERSSFRKFSGKVGRCEEWFAERGMVIFIFSRCVPGTRLPTYLAAGFLRVPWARFLGITGIAALVWTVLILWLTGLAGGEVLRWLPKLQHGGLIVLGAGAGLFLAIHWARRAASAIDLRQMIARLDRWRHWEFWPAWMFYPPVVIYCLWLAIKYRGVTVPTVANPRIFSGGLVGESKMDTLSQLAQTSPEFTAEAELVSGNDLSSRIASLKQIQTRLGLAFPFILKPDFGQRGSGVKLIRTQEQAEDYLQRMRGPVIVQRYVPGPFEVGIFYYRFPHEPRGKIFAITEKIFPTLTGDGVHTVAELIQRDARARLIAGTYLKRFSTRRSEVLAPGESLRLVEAGNHAQGCIFRDGQRLWSRALEDRVDEISKGLGEFYIGRYDVRFESEDDLRAGKNFQILELNGASSEATSIYDARNSLWTAYRTLFQQWNLVFAIGAANRARGFAPMKLPVIWKRWREYLREAAAYPTAD